MTKDNFCSMVYEEKTEIILFCIFFCSTIAFARDIVWGMDSRATELKFVFVHLRISHYASHYHYAS